MEDLLRPIYQERASHSNTLGILYIEKQKPISPITDNFDSILLIIVKDAEDPWYIKHYEYGDEKSAAMHIVDERQLNHWIETSGYRSMLEWVINGKVVFDRNEFVENLKEELRVFPEEKRGLRKVIEFAKLIRSYRQSKDLFETKQFLDAYNEMVRSLHYLARLAVIEKGLHPEVTVWKQVKQISPDIYKLYEELTHSHESTEKRVELMLLATEFEINSRAKSCSQYLLDVMNTKVNWSIGDLKVHPAVQPYALDLSALLEYLVERHIVSVVNIETKGQGIYHRTYKVME
ncbi:nucleotidyltransferase-like protein [Salirhabdus sp. Marseille-P4669]|uniref:nucleotidyltransferase-like protein n=1 Tax=Salirhabdus sp. Marseille-P4669 TaxID=2042310 RepID=UPI000C7E756C|nr:nucleotidyltransferase-like protein [Salirhabdus sp. Marseille-P4669]